MTTELCPTFLFGKDDQLIEVVYTKWERQSDENTWKMVESLTIPGKDEDWVIDHTIIEFPFGCRDLGVYNYRVSKGASLSFDPSSGEGSLAWCEYPARYVTKTAESQEVNCEVENLRSV